MSGVYQCQNCPRRMTDPFVVHGRILCPVCAEDVAPEIVASRERRNYRSYRRNDWIDFGFGRDKRPER